MQISDLELWDIFRRIFGGQFLMETFWWISDRKYSVGNFWRKYLVGNIQWKFVCGKYLVEWERTS